MIEGQPPYGGRLSDIDGKHWIGNESNGHLVDSLKNWVSPVPPVSKPPRVQLIDEPPSFYPIIPSSLR